MAPYLLPVFLLAFGVYVKEIFACSFMFTAKMEIGEVEMALQ